MATRYPTYAIIAPVTKKRLESIARSVSSHFVESPEMFEVVGGTKGHAALWDFEPGGDLALELAPEVSRLVSGTVYVAQLHEHFYGCEGYVDGSATGPVREDPKKLAQRLGVPFPEREVVISEREWSVCVVEGARPSDVRAVLESSPDMTPADFDVVRIDPHPLGALVFATDGTSVTGIPSMLDGPSVAGAITYGVERSHGDVLKVRICRQGKIVRFFTTDESLGLGPPGADRAWDIKGGKDVNGVLAALQIPPVLLGW